MPRVSAKIDKLLQEQALTAAESAALRLLLAAGHVIYKTAAEWSGVTLADKAIGVVTDVSPRVFKIGDGSTVWADLPTGASDKQPLAAALTTYAAGPASAITGALQGEEADPTKISAAFLPDSLSLNYITIGEIAPEAELPEGSLGRDGSTLVMYDADGNPIPVGGDAVENVIPYHRVSGTATMIPFGVSGSRAKQAGAKYWQEIARIKIPAAEVLDGNILRFIAEIHVKSTTAIASLARSMLLVPAEFWDVVDQTTYFGASPSQATFNATSPVFLPFRQAGASSLESTSRVDRSHALVYTSGLLSATTASAGTYQNGYDWTAGAAFSGADTPGFSGFARDNATDLELVLVANSSNTATDFRRLDFNLEISATAP